MNHQEAAELITNLKDHPKNRSSPDIDLTTTREVDENEKPKTDARKESKDESTEEEKSKDEKEEVTILRSEVSPSVDSVGSSQLNHKDQSTEDAVFDSSRKGTRSLSSVTSEPEENPLREDRAGTLNSDMSGSCSTLQNERPDGEMESSSEQSKKQQMSVAFRQELLGVSQLKTDSRIGLEIAKLTEPNFDLVQLLGRSLPHIVPNVSLSKREVGVVLRVWLKLI